MSAKSLIASVTTEFLVTRCRSLGFIPQVTTIPPHNRAFPGSSERALYVKLFGHNSQAVNTVHARWGVVDEDNLAVLGSMDADNLTLTAEDKVLLILSILRAVDSPLASLRTASDWAERCRSLGDIAQALESAQKRI